eukprot:7450873-Heterocapsa_arctica.AAC.1
MALQPSGACTTQIAARDEGRPLPCNRPVIEVALHVQQLRVLQPAPPLAASVKLHLEDPDVIF